MDNKSNNKTIESAGEVAGNSPLRGKLPVWKKLLFATVIVCVFFAAAELMLAMLGITPVLYEKDPYVGFSSHIPLFAEQRSSDGKTYMVTAKNKLVYFNPQQFALDKDTDTYRIFCVGGSTTYGRPYNDMTSFCGWLRAMLAKADPTRKWEVVNAGGISYASYRVAKLMEELIAYKPDLFIIYSGQNEFLEHRTYDKIINMPKALQGIGAITSKTRVYTAVKHFVERMNTKAPPENKKATGLFGEVNTILDNTVGPEVYHRDRELQEQILEHYRYNLIRMIDIARSVDAKSILVRPASKLRDCSPYKSQHRNGLEGAELQKWQALFNGAKKGYDSGRWNDALEAINKAITIDDQYADLHYLHGRVLWELTRYDEAKKAYIRAKDEDICPLRALAAMENIVQEVATRKGVPLVDFIALTEKYSEHATPGEDLFLDHVHPTIEGNRLLALELLKTMSGQGIVNPAETWNDMAIQQVREYIESNLDTKNHAKALFNIAKLYVWCGKNEEGYGMALRAIEMSPLIVNAYYYAAVASFKMKKTDEAIKHSRIYLRFKPDSFETHNNLGAMLASQDKLNEAISHYRKALQINPDFVSAHNNLALALMEQGKFDEALRHFREIRRLKGDLPEALAGIACILATHPEGQKRNPKQAIVLGEHAVELSNHKNARFFDILAMAYASEGRFDQAVTTAQKALSLTSAVDADKPDKAIEQRLELYKQGKPYLQSASK